MLKVRFYWDDSKIEGKKNITLSCDEDDILCKYKRGDELQNCDDSNKISCIARFPMIENSSDGDTFSVYDSNGTMVIGGFADIDYENNVVNKKYLYVENPDGSQTDTEWSLDANNQYYISNYSISTKDNIYTSTNWDIDSQGNIYKSKYFTKNNNTYTECVIEYNENNTVKSGFPKGNGC